MSETFTQTEDNYFFGFQTQTTTLGNGADTISAFGFVSVDPECWAEYLNPPEETGGETGGNTGTGGSEVTEDEDDEDFPIWLICVIAGGAVCFENLSTILIANGWTVTAT